MRSGTSTSRASGRRRRTSNGRSPVGRGYPQLRFRFDRTAAARGTVSILSQLRGFHLVATSNPSLRLPSVSGGYPQPSSAAVHAGRARQKALTVCPDRFQASATDRQARTSSGRGLDRTEPVLCKNLIPLNLAREFELRRTEVNSAVIGDSRRMWAATGSRDRRRGPSPRPGGEPVRITGDYTRTSRPDNLPDRYGFTFCRPPRAKRLGHPVVGLLPPHPTRNLGL